MALKIISDIDGRGFTFVGDCPDVENVNPIAYYSQVSMEHSATLEKAILLLKDPQFPTDNLLDKVLLKRARSKCQEELGKILTTEYSRNFDRLLETDKKKEQVKLLKGEKISPSGLIAFTFKSYLKHGYLFSQCRVDHNHNGLDETRLPKMFHLEEEQVHVTGNTYLTDGQLRQVIKHRKVIISKFIDLADTWHCFFTTYESISGKESWKAGTPHFHYISSAFGYSRDYVLRELKSKNYNLGSLPHIELIDYRR